MKAIFKKVWAFIKKIFHIGRKEVIEAFVETRESIEELLEAELAKIHKQMETAGDEAFEYFVNKGRLIIDTQGYLLRHEIEELPETITKWIQELRQAQVENTKNFD